MMKVSKQYFERFKKECLRLQHELGLTQYRLDFYQKKLKDRDGTTYYAQANIFENDKIAEIFLTMEIKNPEIDEGPESHARHEMTHLLIHRLQWLAKSRFIERSDVDEEVEAIVIRLDKVLK
jgi:hypothetical protein